MQKRFFLISIFNFLFAASLGALLRYAFVGNLDWIEYRNVLHGHSHVAMLGWIYIALYILLIQYFLPARSRQSDTFYTYLFYLTQLSVIGMMIAFPLEGYGPWAISFSSLHALCSYAFAYRFLKDLKQEDAAGKVAIRFAKISIYFMLFSTLALWLMPPLMIFQMKASVLYYSNIQFYLHFQFNGWFIFACLALFFKLLERKNIEFDEGHAIRFMKLLGISCLLNYSLPLIWANPTNSLFAINGISVVLQLGALIFFIRLVKNTYPGLIHSLSPVVLFLLKVAFTSFLLKVFIQSITLIPDIAIMAFSIRNYVIGFMHLLMLGAISHFLFIAAHEEGCIELDKEKGKFGIYILSFGFIISEFLLFLQGSLLWAKLGFLPRYYELLFFSSVLIPLGLLLLFISLLRVAEKEILKVEQQ